MTVPERAATIRRLRGKIGALTKQMKEDREFGYKQLGEIQAAKDRQLRLVNMLILSLLAMDGYAPREVVYFTKTKLEDELIALYPAVAKRLGREPESATRGEP